MNRQALFLSGQKHLTNITPQAYLETLILLSFVLKITRTQLLAHLEHPVSEHQKNQFLTLIHRRSQGEPLAYLTGRCEFWSFPLMITPQCLIPRADTELLVEQVLAYYPSDKNLQVVDLGTGSGAIAIALSLERPHWNLIATDQSKDALRTAQYNAQCLGATVEFREGDWLNAISQQQGIDVIMSNPPYLKKTDTHLKGSLRYEPQTSLIGGVQGTEILHHLIQHAPRYLAPGGRLWLEQGFDQADIIRSYFKQYHYIDIQQHKDLGGIRRITSGSIY